MRFPDPNSLILDLFKRIGNASCLRKLHLIVPPGYRPVTHGFSQIEARLFAPFEDCYDMGPWSNWGVVEALRGLVQGTRSLEVTVTELYYVGIARPPCGRFFNRMRNVVGIWDVREEPVQSVFMRDDRWSVAEAGAEVDPEEYQRDVEGLFEGCW